MIVYCFTHLETGRKYVGKSLQTIKSVKRRHLNATTYFGSVLRKYGIDNFTVEIIDRAETNEELKKKESFWIDKLDTIGDKGFNLSSGGEGAEGWNGSDETRKALSIASTGRRKSIEERNKISLSQIERHGKRSSREYPRDAAKPRIETNPKTKSRSGCRHTSLELVRLIRRSTKSPYELSVELGMNSQTIHKIQKRLVFKNIA